MRWGVFIGALLGLGCVAETLRTLEGETGSELRTIPLSIDVGDDGQAVVAFTDRLMVFDTLGKSRRLPSPPHLVTWLSARRVGDSVLAVAVVSRWRHIDRSGQVLAVYRRGSPPSWVWLGAHSMGRFLVNQQGEILALGSTHSDGKFYLALHLFSRDSGYLHSLVVDQMADRGPGEWRLASAPGKAIMMLPGVLVDARSPTRPKGHGYITQGEEPTKFSLEPIVKRIAELEGQEPDRVYLGELSWDRGAFWVTLEAVIFLAEDSIPSAWAGLYVAQLSPQGELLSLERLLARRWARVGDDYIDPATGEPISETFTSTAQVKNGEVWVLWARGGKEGSYCLRSYELP